MLHDAILRKVAVAFLRRQQPKFTTGVCNSNRTVKSLSAVVFAKTPKQLQQTGRLQRKTSNQRSLYLRNMAEIRPDIEVKLAPLRAAVKEQVCYCEIIRIPRLHKKIMNDLFYLAVVYCTAYFENIL